MITTSKLQYIEDNIYIPQPGEYTDAHDNESKQRIVDIWEDEHFFIPYFCTIVNDEHYESFVTFLKEIDELAINAKRYIKIDDVIRSPYTTAIYYINPETNEQEQIGYDHFPVIQLECNGDCYFAGCENWTVEHELLESQVEGGKAKSETNEYFQYKYIEKLLDNLSITASNSVTYFDMPVCDIKWLKDKEKPS